MTLRDLKLNHLKLISLFSTRYAIRGGTGLVFLLLVLATGLMAAHLLMAPVEQIKIQTKKESGLELTDEEVHDQLIKFARPAVQWIIAGSSDEDRNSAEGEGENEELQAEDSAEVWTTYLLDDNPALLSAVLLIMIFATPFLIAAGAFNQFSGDVQSRGLRFQLLRTERTNIYLGRFLGSAIYAVLIMALLIAIIALYLGIKTDIYQWGAIIKWSLRGLLALGLVTLPYVALCTWISGAIDSPFGSLTISTLIIGAVPLFAALAKNTWEPAVNIKYVLPWGLQNYLLHPQPAYLLGAMAACLSYTLVFLFIGHRHFVKRDL